jgi:hypothetical protein
MWNQRNRGHILRIRICWSEEGWTSDDESQHGPQGRTQGVLRPPLGFRHPAAVRLARGSSDHRNSDGHHRDISGGARNKIRFGFAASGQRPNNFLLFPKPIHLAWLRQIGCGYQKRGFLGCGCGTCWR